MKAEHRKELETNILADRMGKIITGAKKGPSRGFVFYILCGLAVAALIFIFYRWRTTSADTAGSLWVAFEDGNRRNLNEVLKQGTGTNSAKAVRFQAAWEDFWFRGIKLLGANPKLAQKGFDDARETYKKLAEECKGDPVFHPEALFGLAVIEETDAINNRENLVTALGMYKELVKSYKESAFAKMAIERIASLEDEDKLRDQQRFYQDLKFFLDARDRPPMFPPNLKK